MKQPIRIIGVPMDLGQSRRGVDMGAAAIRYAGLIHQLRLLGYPVHDYGDISIPVRDNLRNTEEFVTAIQQVNEDTYQAAVDAIEAGEFPIFLGGDHSISNGTIGGITHREPCGVIWIDAHTDFNTPSSSPSGNIHGMTLSVLMGEGDRRLCSLGREGAKLTAKDVSIIAIRDIDQEEKERVRDHGLKVYTMRDIDEQGMSTIAHKALTNLDHHERIHVSLDIDALDPSIAPGAGTLVPGGLSYREAQLLMEIIADSGRLRSIDIVEINPILDTENKTARIAVELVTSLFGKRII